ncbi:CheY-like chemotaxis protein [Algoriphagus ratkowskyi]|uniref:CheY-like chemotaxis protein n=1 Tax=Algoriphagus ratkowskyi TaxID=57028 RepID=A0A2W7S2V9_9BACT|nr:response regulator [Algoriphagus ratkowskyi]PZX61289.1 CheY-like chemotaxis protein [Algoriphagus ratkowskyi]TXD79401.1 response regulator [Algoriphagus ratkowskyi]
MKDKLTIFYTDDDEDDLDFFRKIIEVISEKYELITYTDGFQLIQALENPPPNPYLLFLDINMPGMTGMQVLENIRKSKNYGLLPIIMFSTTQDQLVIRKAHELGANFFIPKADSFLKLKASIQYALEINWDSFNPDFNGFLYKK